MGITAFVLKYRLGPRYHHPIELGDAQRAIRLVRSRAREFEISPDRIGMMGFSAGGHLASTTATHFDSGNPAAADPIDRASSRPDFVILGYPVITLEMPYVHAGSARNLLGDNPDPKLVEELSNELHVTPQTPPTFLFATSDDDVVPVENSVNFYARAAQSRRSGGAACLREGSAWSWSCPGRSCPGRVAGLAGELAAPAWFVDQAKRRNGKVGGVPPQFFDTLWVNSHTRTPRILGL